MSRPRPHRHGGPNPSDVPSPAHRMLSPSPRTQKSSPPQPARACTNLLFRCLVVSTFRRLLPTFDFRLSTFFALFVAAGCTGPSRSNEGWFNRKSPRQWLDIALEHPQPDERRKAVAALANGPEGGADWAATAFDSIARTDPDGMVRAAAVRGLARSADGRTVPTLVKLLNSNEVRLDDTLPAPGPVRWEAAQLLEHLHERDAVPPSERETVLAAVRMRADHDTDRNVRLSALSTLGYYKDARVFPVLIAALQSRDFAIQRRAEHALYRLTGQSHELDAAAWHDWLSKTPDPFAQAPPASAPSPPRSFWKRLFGAT